MSTIVQTSRAPQAIGTYSQAVRAGDTVYISCLLYTSDAADE